MEREVQPLLNEIFGDGEWLKTIVKGRPNAHGAGWIYELKKQKGLGGDPEAQTIAGGEKLMGDSNTMVSLLHFSAHF